jgi:hypothetical protein
MTLRIRQIVFAARDLDGVVARFERVFKLSVAYRDPLVAEFGLRNALLPIGDQFVEVVSPTREGTAAGRHLERHGDSAYMLILQTEDIARDRARLDRLGVRVIWRADYPDIHATQIHPKDIGAAIVSLDEPSPPDSWRWAGPEWQRHVQRTGARGIGDVTISAGDPSSMAQRWAEVLGTQKPVADGSTYRLPLSGSAVTFEKGATDVIAGYEIAVTDLRDTLAAAQAEALSVTDRTITLCGTRFRLR